MRVYPSSLLNLEIEKKEISFFFVCRKTPKTKKSLGVNGLEQSHNERSSY